MTHDEYRSKQLDRVITLLEGILSILQKKTGLYPVPKGDGVKNPVALALFRRRWGRRGIK